MSSSPVLQAGRAELTVCEALAAIGEGSFTSESYVTELLERSARARELNAFITLEPELALDAARKADVLRRAGDDRPLLGLPLVCKDNVATRRMPTTGGTPGLIGHQPSEDAPVVARLLEAGALLLGKTNLHELGFGVTGGNGRFGAVRNPYASDRAAGGSSSGTAAAVAARLAPAGLATDTGGSARIPAALCGIAGFRPSHGRYPLDGVVPISPTRDSVGLMARSVDDLLLLDSILSEERFTPTRSLAGTRIGLPRAHFYEDLDRPTAAAVEGLLCALANQGLELVEVDIEGVTERERAASFPVALYEARRELQGYARAAGLELTALVEQVSSPDVREILEAMLGDPIPDAVYAEALQAVRALRVVYERYFDEHRLQAVLFPTTPCQAPPLDVGTTMQLNGREVPVFSTLSRNTSPGSLGGIPGLSLPLALVDGLPVGIELDGPRGSDRELLALGAALASSWEPLPRPALPET